MKKCRKTSIGCIVGTVPVCNRNALFTVLSMTLPVGIEYESIPDLLIRDSLLDSQP